MKKAISTSLNRLAADLPLLFKEHPDSVLMTGKELKLTPYDDMMELHPDQIYEIPIPKFVAVEHKQQLKDRMKQGGFPAVKEYVDSVMSKAKLT